LLSVVNKKSVENDSTLENESRAGYLLLLVVNEPVRKSTRNLPNFLLENWRGKKKETAGKQMCKEVNFSVKTVVTYLLAPAWRHMVELRMKQVITGQ
jgi:hypothetical protein